MDVLTGNSRREEGIRVEASRTQRKGVAHDRWHGGRMLVPQSENRKSVGMVRARWCSGRSLERVLVLKRKSDQADGGIGEKRPIGGDDR